MEAIAKLKNVPTSPRKMRLIADLIRGKRVNSALNQLKFDSKYSSNQKIRKTFFVIISFSFIIWINSSFLSLWY